MVTPPWPQCCAATILAVLAASVAVALSYDSCPEELADVKKCLKQYFNDTDRELPERLKEMLTPSRRRRRSIVFNQEHCHSFREFIRCSDDAVAASSSECASHVEEKLCAVLKSFFLTYQTPICEINFQQWLKEDGHRACVTQDVASGQVILTYPSMLTLLALTALLKR